MSANSTVSGKRNLLVLNLTMDERLAGIGSKSERRIC